MSDEYDVYIEQSGFSLDLEIETGAVGPAGPAGAPGSGFTTIASGTILGNGSGSPSLPIALEAAAARSVMNAASLAGNNFTGKQTFSGTDHVGLCLHSLTSAQYNALTATNGDLFRDSTTDRIDARLARGTVEMLDTAGNQIVLGTLQVNGEINANSATLRFANRVLLAATNSSILRITDAVAAAGFSIDCATDNQMTLRNRGNTAAGNLNVGNITASGNIVTERITFPGATIPPSTGYGVQTWSGVGVVLFDQGGLFTFSGPSGTNSTRFNVPTTGTWEQRAGAAAQTHSIYGTFTDNSNYRRLRFSSTTAGAFAITAEGLGTGASGNTLTLGPDISTGNLTASGTVNANAVQLAGVDLYAALMTNLRSIDMGWTTGAVTGSASTGPQGSTISTNRIDNQTGATAGSTFVRSVGIWGGNDNAAFHETLSYSRPIGFLCSLYRTSTSTNSIARFLIANQNGAMALAAPGFGFEIRNERIWIVAHDGTTLTQLDTGVNWYTGAVNLMRCESNGSGSISLFRGTTLLGSVTGAPIGTFPAFISVSGTNGADSNSLRFQYNRLFSIRV
jgi:hypothetical protein